MTPEDTLKVRGLQSASVSQLRPKVPNRRMGGRPDAGLGILLAATKGLQILKPRLMCNPLVALGVSS
jgi:hypothetical protein